jgi:hypothetical protein
MPAKEIFKIYDAILSSPGMLDNVKLDLRICRKNALLLSRLIEQGLSKEENIKDEIFSQLPEETTEELQALSNEILKKAGLSEFDEKLRLLVW